MRSGRGLRRDVRDALLVLVWREGLGVRGRDVRRGGEAAVQSAVDTQCEAGIFDDRSINGDGPAACDAGSTAVSSAMARCWPMQPRGPSPNGSSARVCSSVSVSCRAGLKRSGSFQRFGFWLMARRYTFASCPRRTRMLTPRAVTVTPALFGVRGMPHTGGVRRNVSVRNAAVCRSGSSRTLAHSSGRGHHGRAPTTGRRRLSRSPLRTARGHGCGAARG